MSAPHTPYSGGRLLALGSSLAQRLHRALPRPCTPSPFPAIPTPCPRRSSCSVSICVGAAEGTEEPAAGSSFGRAGTVLPGDQPGCAFRPGGGRAVGGGEPRGQGLGQGLTAQSKAQSGLVRPGVGAASCRASWTPPGLLCRGRRALTWSWRSLRARSRSGSTSARRALKQRKISFDSCHFNKSNCGWLPFISLPSLL